MKNKDIFARTDAPGAGPTVFIDIQVGEIWATVNMTHGDIAVTVYNEDNEEFDLTDEVLADWSVHKVHSFEDLAELRNAMESYTPEDNK